LPTQPRVTVEFSLFQSKQHTGIQILHFTAGFFCTSRDINSLVSAKHSTQQHSPSSVANISL